ncbi:MAG: DtxR family transcriptional regulator [bacterium]
MTLSAEMEDYLEVIAALIKSNGEARVTDIAKRLSVRKPSVTQALRSLKEKGLLLYKPYCSPVLTESGKRAAAAVQRRHNIMKRFLADVLLIDPDKADANACRLEHAADKEVLEHLTHFMDFVQHCPRGGAKWIRGYEYYCDPELEGEKCEQCLQMALADFRQHRVSSPSLDKADEQRTMETDIMTLAELKQGQTAQIVRVGKAGSVRKRIVDMGAVRGAPVTVVKVAPLGDPIEVKIKGYNLTLRKSEASTVEVEIKQPDD